MINKFKYLAIVALLMTAGCGKDEEKPDPYDTRYSRMEDPEYVAAIDAQLKDRNEIMARSAKLAEEYQAELAKDPNSPRAKELEAERAKLVEDLRRHRAKSQALVATRMRRENEAIKAREAREAADKETK